MLIRAAVSDRKTEENQTGLDTAVFLSVFFLVIVFNDTLQS